MSKFLRACLLAVGFAMPLASHATPPTNTTDLAGNALTGVPYTSGETYILDNVAPTATLSVSPATLKVGASATVTITFSEAVTGFTNADLTVANGTLSAVSSADSGVTWTATLTPATATSDATNVITLDNTGVTDAVGNAGTGTTSSNNYVIDTVRPTATIAVATTPLKIGATSGVTITFSEAVTGFTNADLTVANGTLSAVSSSDGGVTWTATLTPATATTDATNIITLDNTGVTDAVGNTGTGTTNSNNYVIDTVAPTATLTVATTPLKIGATSGVTITFSEPVSGFTNADLTVPSGTLTAVSSSDGGTTWTATFTPAASTTAATNAIVLDNTGVTDAVGNAGTGTTNSNNFAVDTVAPNAPTGLDLTAASDSGSSSTDDLTKVTTPVITGGAEANATVKLYDTDGTTLIGTGTADGSGAWSITTTTLSAGAHTITAKATDAAGNTGAASSGLAITIDTTAPTVASSVRADANPTLAASVQFNVTFSEAVSGVDQADFALTSTVAGSSIASVTGSGTTYTVTVTVGSSGSGTVRLDVNGSTSISDSAGNSFGAAYTSGELYNVDHTPPTVSSIVRAASTPINTNGASVTYRVTFNEAVNGVDAGDFTVTATGTAAGSVDSVSAVSTSVYDVTLVSVGGFGTLRVDLNASATGITDAVGNAIATGFTNGDLYVIGAENVLDTIALASGSGRTVSSAGLKAAQSFTVAGAEPLTLFNVAAQLATVVGTPSPTVTINSDNAGVPGAVVATLTNPSALTSNKVAVWTTATTLSPNTRYWLVFASASGTFVLSNTNATSGGLGTWFDAGAYATSSFNSSWSSAAGALRIGLGAVSAPGITSVTPPANAAYRAGTNLDFTVNFGSSVTVTGAPTLALTIGSTPVTATYVSGAPGTALLFRYTVQAGENDADGIAVSSPLALSGGTIRSGASIDAQLGFTPPTTTGVLVDTAVVAPTGLALATASNSGSTSDTLTNAATPTINGGGAEAGASVTLYDTDGTTALGTATADGSGNWSVASTTLADGTHTVTAKQTDLAGNVSAASSGLAITIDATVAAPSGLALATASNSGSTSDTLTNVTTPAINGGAAEAGATIKLYDTDGTTLLGTATADGSGNWSVASSALGAGAHTLTAKQTDLAANVSVASSSLGITIDTSAAAPTGLALANASNSGSTSDTLTNATTPTINGGGAEAGATIKLYDTDGTTLLGTATADGSGNWSVTASTLAGGAHTLTAKQTDLAANVSAASASLSITIDTAAPAAPSVPDLAVASDSGASSSDDLTKITTPVFTGTAEAGTTVTLYDTDGTTAIGSATATGGNWSITASTLGEGTHTITAKSTDGAANVSAASAGLTITIDTTATAPTGLDMIAASDTGADTDNITTVTAPTIEGAGAETGATVTLYDTNGTTVLGTATAGAGGSWSITTSTLGEGAHTLTAKQVDLAGNTSAASGSLVVTVDNTAPAVASVLRQTPNTVNTPSTSVTFRVTFAEAVTGVDASDFTLTVVSGTASGTLGTVTPVSASVYEVQVNSVAGQGRLRVDLKASGTGIADLATNALPAGGFTTGDFYYAGVENVLQTTLLSSDGTQTISSAASAAQRFTTAAAAPLSLTTVSAALGAVNGATPVVEIHEDNAGAVGNLVTTLTNPASLTPNALNVWTSTQLLGANQTYWAVFAATAGDYVIKSTSATTGGLGSWLTAPTDYVYRTGAALGTANNGALQIAIGATSTPTITSALIAGGTYGTPFSGYSVTATNLPTSFAATGLPPGLTLNSATGAISGTPAQAGTFNVALTGTNNSGAGVASTLVFTVAKAPLTATVQAATRAYLAPNPPFVISYSGFQLGDNENALSTKPVADTNAQANAPVGDYALTLGGGAAANYTFTYLSSTLTITKAFAAVTVPNLTTPYDGTAKSVTATTDPAGLTVTLTYAGSAAAPSNPGTYAVTATIVDPNYTGSGAGTLVIGKAPASIAFGNLSFTYDGAPKATTVTTTPNGLAVTLTYNGSATAPTNAGTYTVEATATGPNHAGSATATLTIGKATQTVTFSPLGTLNPGAPTTLNATASTGLPITFSVVSGPATISGSALTPTGGGTVLVRATQAGDANYLPASADQSGTVSSKTPQTIDFAAVAAHLSTDGIVELTATASSGLPVTFTVVSGPALWAGDNLLVLTGVPGMVTVRASQDGNATFAPAPDVERTFEIVDASTDTFFGDLVEDGSTAGASGRSIAASVSEARARSVTANKAGDIAAAITANTRGGSLLIVAPSIGLNVSLDFTLNADGTYTIPLTSGGQSLAVVGSLVGGTLTGHIPELHVQFTTQVLSREGPTAAYVGVYKSSALATTQGSTVSIVGSNGQALVLATTPAVTTGGLTQVNADGTFSLTTSAATVSGTVDAPTATLTGSIKMGQTEIDYSGLKSQVQRTDRLFNLSSRSRVGADTTSTVITGFVIGGTAPKTLLLRAAGPSLTQFGVSNALANPRIRLFDGRGQLLRENDDWTGADVTSAAVRTGAFGFTPGSKDAAMLVTLDPGAYTVHVLDGGGTGVTLAEIYDASVNPQGEYQRLINISSRGVVTTGEGALIGGFVITGNSPKRVLIRGTGPALAAYGVTDVLANPMLKLYNGEGEVIAQNDDWETALPLNATQTAATAAEIASANAATGAFGLQAGAKDSALIVTLAPGVYTAQITGPAGATGAALVEIYEIP